MKILLADDEETIAVTLGDALRGAGHEVLVVADGTKAVAAIRRDTFDVVITDIRMPGVDGLELFQEIRKVQPAARVIFITAYANVEGAVAAIREGAEDYVQKPFFNDDILTRLNRIEKVQRLEDENRRLKEELVGRDRLGKLIGKSQKMQEVYDLILAVAGTDANILIEGENGTGKELVAEAIHYKSPRRDHEHVKMSCSVFPEGLIDSELFGHVKGAFTDARADKPGRFERAHKGTLFIDDVDDLTLTTQVKLLRVLQEREFERVGGTKLVKVDVRIVAATKKDLWTMVKEKTFREDLFHRLNVVKILLPPLREREEDIPLLVELFMKKYGKGQDYKIPLEAMESLRTYAWPGNVRELEHSIERAVALAGPELTLKKEHLLRPLSMPGSDVSQGGSLSTLKKTVSEAEARHIRSVLTYTRGHKGEAARILGITRKNLWEKLRDYGIE